MTEFEQDQEKVCLSPDPVFPTRSNTNQPAEHIETQDQEKGKLSPDPAQIQS